MPLATSYEVDNDMRFRLALERAAKTTSDLRVPLTLIGKDFYKSERAIFKLKSPGQYPDLSDKYKPVKQKAAGFIYPILKRSGRLADSLTDPDHEDSINVIVNRRGLIIGTKVPYGIYHQSDASRTKLPLRKFLFIGPEAPKFAKGPLAGRPERWFNILNEFVLQKLSQDGWDVGIPTDQIPPLKVT